MNDLFAAAERVQQFCAHREWRTCFIGGIALQRWGQQRQTKDGDLTLLTGFGQEEHYVDEILGNFRARRDDAREFGLQSRVVLIWDEIGIPFDIALGGLPFEERTITRATSWATKSGENLITCSAEDLIVHKAFADRGIDWFDIEGILMRQGQKLDTDLIFRELRPLIQLKEAPGIEERLRRMMEAENA